MSISIDNFFLGVEEWVQVTDSLAFSVDVIDSDHGISMADTYFMRNGSIVSTSYSGISDGYRVSYTPPTPSGSIYLTLHAENNNGDSVEEDYSFLFGYNVKFEEYVDWGPNKEILIWAKASNTAFCPNIEAQATYFQTKDLNSRDLNAVINPVGYVDLSATVYPQNTFFFYGRTFTVTVSGIKDYNNNEMEPFSFSFTIEDPTS